MIALVVVHVLSALGFFVAFGVEIPLLLAMRRARSTHELRLALGGFAINTRLGPPALLTIVASGIGLAVHGWGWHFPAWIGASFAALVVNAVIGAAITGRIVVGLERAIGATEGALDGAMTARARSPWLAVSFAARVAIVGAIAGVMLTRPSAVGAIVVLALVPLGASLGAGWMARRASA